MSYTRPPFPGYVAFFGDSQKFLVPTNFVVGLPGGGWNRPGPNELNTLAQQCQTAEQMRKFPAFPAMVCFLQGIEEPADGLGGMFYWSAGEYTDDGLDTIVPTIRPWPFGAGSEGAWLRAEFPGDGTTVSITAESPIVVTPSPILRVGVISMLPSGVTPDTYGDATHGVQITVNENGIVTEVEEVLFEDAIGRRNPVVFSFSFDPDASTRITYVAVCPLRVAANAAWFSRCEDNPDAPATFVVEKILSGVTTPIGDVVVGTGGTVTSSPTYVTFDMAIGDAVTCTSPSSPDATMADIGIGFLATKIA